jgi:hypothetical protein
MFENFSNLIFIAVALAVFVGRTVAQARKRREADEEKAADANSPQRPGAGQGARQATRPAAPRVPPVHFEEKSKDDDYVPGYMKKSSPAKPAAKKPAAKPAPAPIATPILPSANLDKLFPARAPMATRANFAEQEFSFNLGHLSPLKQAVIMAEILGPPKAFNTNAGER